MAAKTSTDNRKALEEEIVCLYIGTDPWQAVRWRSCFSRASLMKIVLRSMVDMLIGADTNLAMLSAANNLLRDEPMYGHSRTSICIVDLSFNDLDSQSLESLRNLIVKVKEGTNYLSQHSYAEICSPIVVLVPEELEESRDWITSIGASLVGGRSKDFEGIVKNCAKIVPRFLKVSPGEIGC